MARTFGSGVELEFTDDKIAILRMRNGENRIDTAFTEAVNKALDAVERNQDCRALVTTGEGKFFSNGLDFKFLRGDPIKRNQFGVLCMRLLVFPIPTVAAINGHAFAGGALFAFYHDFRVMQTQKGWISLNEIFINARIGHNIPLIKAKFSPRAGHELVVMGKRFTAQEALTKGIVDKISSPENLMSSARSLANQFTLKQSYDRDMMKLFKEDLYSEVLRLFNETSNTISKL